jgi:3-oxoacyl-[acyl-carrier protein] reductase
MLQAEDVAELVLATLALPARVFVRDVALLTTNPV